MRLSQFLILPPHLRLGLGSRLYRHVYEKIAADANIMDFTGTLALCLAWFNALTFVVYIVEDPSPEFAVFRLQNDYAIYLANSEDVSKQALKFSEVNSSISSSTIFVGWVWIDHAAGQICQFESCGDQGV